MVSTRGEASNTSIVRESVIRPANGVQGLSRPCMRLLPPAATIMAADLSCICYTGAPCHRPPSFRADVVYSTIVATEYYRRPVILGARRSSGLPLFAAHESR